ncbi:MAG TPA: hypothetical protein VGU03_02370 [Frateuria sp.]|uniref:hypothetical protein n=1 Tax=Frateuria sp. TaxID=2211372 RepID=UPI002DEC2BF7|nr:hypothetical protein [Frateuria sp.]
MDSRLLHLTYSKAFASVAWDRHGEHEYVLVGDGLAIEHSSLQELIDLTFSTNTLWLSPSRHSALSVLRSKAADFMASRLQPRATVVLTDEDVSTFIELSFLGVARTGKARANYSFKRTR